MDLSGLTLARLFFFGICDYHWQNLVPGSICFLGNLAQTSFERWGKLELPVRHVLEAHLRTREQQALCIRMN